VFCLFVFPAETSSQPGPMRLSDLAHQKPPGPRRIGDARNSPTESLANLSQISTASSRSISQEITTLRPRSGKEYQRINRRRLGSASGSDTSPLTVSMTPHSPGSASLKTQVFTFDNSSLTGGSGTDSPRRDSVARARLSTSAASNFPEAANSSSQVCVCVVGGFINSSLHVCVVVGFLKQLCILCIEGNAGLRSQNLPSKPDVVELISGPADYY